LPIIICKRTKETYIAYNEGHQVDKSRFLIDINEIALKYRYLMIFPLPKLQIFLSRVFNDEASCTCEPRKFAIVEVLYPYDYNASQRVYKGYFIDVHKLATELSIADGYFMEILAISWIDSVNGQKIVFPNETKVDGEKEIENAIKQRYSSLSKISAVSQSNSILSSFGLKAVVDELSAGYADFEKGDTDGTIKHYRKVIEGYKNFLVQKESVDGKNEYKFLIDNSNDRTEKLVDFLKKSYNLLSNFGEHVGTTVSDDERILANNIVEGLTQYITKKLEKKSLTDASS
jgi:hypothetical protein